MQARPRTRGPGSFRAAVMIAAVLLPAPLFAQGANLVTAGRVEGAGPTLSLGSAASGTVRDVLVREGERVHAGEALITLDCQPIEAELQAREAQLAAAQAAFDRTRNGSRPDEIAVGEAVVGYSQARNDEAQKTLERTEKMHEGVSVTVAHMLEVERDARIAAAQLTEARAKLSLLRAGSREEDVREAQSRRDAAAAEVAASRARLDQCSIRAPVDGVVLEVRANQGRFLSLAVPEPLLRMAADDPLRVRAEIELRDLGRVCVSQRAAVTAEAFPNTSIRAQVASISPEVTARTIATAGPETRPREVVDVMLNVEPGGPALPIGLPVMVRFEPCPKT
jgi:HlyD family secretion protein